MDQLRSGHKGGHSHRANEDKNDRVAVKWLSDTVNELKVELVEIQGALNATIILQNREQLDTDLSLLRADVANLNQELEAARNKNAKYEAEISAVRDELNSVKDHAKTTAIVCGKTKNQVSYTVFHLKRQINALKHYYVLLNAFSIVYHVYTRYSLGKSSQSSLSRLPLLFA